MDQITATVNNLQKKIRDSRARLDGLALDSPGYESALHEVISATNALLSYEQRIPDLRDEPNRERSGQVLVWSARGWGLIALATGVSAALGWVSLG